MRNVFLVLQVLSAWFLTLLGIAELLKSATESERFLGAILAAIGLTFLSLLFVNIAKIRRS